MDVGVIISFILKGNISSFSTSIQVLGCLLAWVIINIAVVVFIGYPYFLQGYYRFKNPEEYREWEGESLEVWYGRKYLRKHKVN